MKMHASYVLNSYSSLQGLSLEKLLQVGWIQNEDEIPIPSFDENLLINLCSDAKKVFENEDIILEIEGDTIIVGDIHGNFHDLLRILKYIESNPSKVIFLGDYVDRGSFSVECITLLFSVKILYPNKFFLLRGNHEFDNMCSQYGFKKEILNYHNPKKLFQKQSDITNRKDTPNLNNINFDEVIEEKKKVPSNEQLCDEYFANHVNFNCYKYTEKLYESFLRAFAYLPIAAIVNKTSLCIHGGLSPLLDKIEKIKKHIQRPIDDYDNNLLLSDIVWGDPSSEIKQFFGENPRGRGKLFSGVTVVNFLKNNNINRIIRAHQCVNEGIEEAFNEKCITVFSASSYSQEMGNKSGIVKIFQNTDKVESISFDPLRHLKKCDAIYYKVEMYNEKNQPISLNSRLNIKSIASYAVLPDSLRTEETNNVSSAMLLQENESNSNKSSQLCSPICHFRAIRTNSSCINHRILNPVLSINNRSQFRKTHHLSISSPMTSLYHNSSTMNHCHLQDNINNEKKIGNDDLQMRISHSEDSLPQLSQKVEI